MVAELLPLPLVAAVKAGARAGTRPAPDTDSVASAVESAAREEATKAGEVVVAVEAPAAASIWVCHPTASIATLRVRDDPGVKVTTLVLLTTVSRRAAIA